VLWCFSAAISEVDISEQWPLKNSPGIHVIFATFSLSPHQTLEWYFKGHRLERSTSKIIMRSDGLNAVLLVKASTKDVYGKYTLLIAGTSVRDTIAFLPGR